MQADLTQLCNTAQPSLGPNGIYYYNVEFEIVLNFGLTEFSAVTRWTRNVSGTPLIIVQPTY